MSTMSEARSEQIAFVALGSNLGDRVAHLRSAIDAFRRDPDITVIDVSPVYASPAHTLTAGEAKPFFFNAVAKISTSMDPHTLLERLHAIEHVSGRRREDDPQWAPRTLDLDLLIFGSEEIQEEQLTVPHPRLGVRRFVLRPWADLDAGRYVPPPYDQTVADLLAACPDGDRPVRTPFTL